MHWQPAIVSQISSIEADKQTFIFEVQSRNGCTKCQRGEGCGAGLLDGLLYRKPYQIKLQSSKKLKCNQQVWLGLTDLHLQRNAAIIYGLPVILLLFGVGLSYWFLPSHDGWQILGAFIGLSVGIVMTGYVEKNQRINQSRIIVMENCPSRELV